jgi:hypothetical protein
MRIKRYKKFLEASGWGFGNQYQSFGSHYQTQMNPYIHIVPVNEYNFNGDILFIDPFYLNGVLVDNWNIFLNLFYHGIQYNPWQYRPSHGGNSGLIMCGDENVPILVSKSIYGVTGLFYPKTDLTYTGTVCGVESGMICAVLVKDLEKICPNPNDVKCNGVVIHGFNDIIYADNGNLISNSAVIYTDGSDVIYCSHCNGTGNVACNNCYGKGIRTCDLCKGNKKIKCDTCEGGGFLEDGSECFDCEYGKTVCDKCKGRGSIECLECKGSGNKKCDKCNGKPIEYPNSITSLRDFRKIRKFP